MIAPARTALLAAGLLLSGGVSATTPTNEELVHAMFEAFNAHDVKALSDFYTEDAKVYSPEHCTPMIGAQAIGENYAMMFEQIPDLHDALEIVVADGNRVAVVFTASSKLPGAEFRLPIAAVLQFEDGKIVEDRVFYDTDNPPTCDSP